MNYSGNEKVNSAIKKGLIYALADEYANSDCTEFMNFLYQVFILSGSSTYLPNYITDTHLLELVMAYSYANNMNEALE